MGKESSAAANSGFPKHKELFTEGYFNGEPTYEDQRKKFFEENHQSPLDKKFNEVNDHYKRDAKRYSDHGYEVTKLDGGILRNYKKL